MTNPTWNNGEFSSNWDRGKISKEIPSDWMISTAHEWLADCINKDFVICKRCKLQILVNGPEWGNIMKCYPHYESKTSGYLNED